MTETFNIDDLSLYKENLIDAIATAKEKLVAKGEYSVSLEPERTTLSLVMDVEARDKTGDKIEKRAIIQ